MLPPLETAFTRVRLYRWPDEPTTVHAWPPELSAALVRDQLATLVNTSILKLALEGVGVIDLVGVTVAGIEFDGVIDFVGVKVGVGVTVLVGVTEVAEHKTKLVSTIPSPVPV